jgi:hypothetical protein
MSQEHIDVARGWYEAFNRWSESYWADPGGPLSETPGNDELFDRMVPEVEWALPFGQTARGRDQLSRVAADWIETVDSWRLEIEDVIDGTGGRVVVIHHVVARGRGKRRSDPPAVVLGDHRA